MTIENASRKALIALSQAKDLKKLACCVPYAIDCLLPPKLELNLDWYKKAQSRKFSHLGGVILDDAILDLNKRGVVAEQYAFTADGRTSKPKSVAQMLKTITRRLSSSTYGALISETYLDTSGKIYGHVCSIGPKLYRRDKVEYYDSEQLTIRRIVPLHEILTRARNYMHPYEPSVYILRRTRS